MTLNNKKSPLINLGVTYGAEIEIPYLTRGEAKRLSYLKNGFFSETRDASVETRLVKENSVSLVVRRSPFPIRNASPVVCGVELITSIRNDSREQALFYYEDIFSELKKEGELEKDYRCGIHIHISMGDNLRVLKAITRLAMYLESVFFYIGGMGYAFRGIGNDSAYMRPITENGPLYIPTTDGWRPCFVIDDLLDSTSTNDFWIKYGDAYSQKGSRYVPVRYHWINLYSILKQGSLEFRIFNLTLNYKYMVAIIELCRAFSQFCLNTNLFAMKELGFISNNSIYYNQSKERILETFRLFANTTQMNPIDVEILSDIIMTTPVISLENEPRACHLRSMPTHWVSSSRYLPDNRRSIDSLQKTKILDIHVLNGER